MLISWQTFKLLLSIGDPAARFALQQLQELQKEAFEEGSPPPEPEMFCWRGNNWTPFADIEFVW